MMADEQRTRFDELLTAYTRALRHSGGYGSEEVTVAGAELRAYVRALDPKAESEPSKGAQAAPEPVAWFEAEPSASGQPLTPELLLGMMYSTRWHFQRERPDTRNPVWPLYAAQPPEATKPTGSAS